MGKNIPRGLLPKKRLMAVRAKARKYYKQKYNRELWNLYHRRWYLKTMYGITEADYDRMLACDGLCEICRRPETATRNGQVRLLCVDHDHQTKQVRGILCASCNRAVGFLGDDPLRAEALVKYLERARGVH